MKNYWSPSGVSKTFFFERQEYSVSGPFGTGLLPQENGVQIGFGSGTGVLTFVDFIASIARKVLDRYHTPKRHTPPDHSHAEAANDSF